MQRKQKSQEEQLAELDQLIKDKKEGRWPELLREDDDGIVVLDGKKPKT